LIVSPVLADDVNAVLDRTGVADLGGDRVVGRPLTGRARVGAEGATAVGLAAVGDHALLGGHVEDAERPAVDRGDVFADGLAGLEPRPGAVHVGPGGAPAAVGDVEPLAVRVVADRGGIHPG